MQGKSSTVLAPTQAAGHGASSGVAGRPGRGIQLEDVLAAADSLVEAGLKPTIERVRQKLGRGSPNTVSPMLDVWFETLGKRLKGLPTVADEKTRKLPLEVVQVAQHFWDVATHNAQQAQIQLSEATRRELELQQASLEARELNVQQRESAFVEARRVLDDALASAKQENEVLHRQLAERTARADEQAATAAQQLRSREAEVGRLSEEISKLQASRDALRSEHAAALAEQERAARASEERQVERHVNAERRLLTEVDRAREEAKQALAAVAKERTARAQIEEDLAELRAQVAQDLAAARTAAMNEQASANGRLQEAQALHQREMQAHEETRRLLAQAMAVQTPDGSDGPAAKPPAAKRVRKKQ